MKFVITRLYLEHFGQFHKKEIIPGERLNVIYGPNEAGKSTLCHFILAMLFDMERARGRAAKDDFYAKYMPWEPGGYSGTMEFVWNGRAYVLYRNFTIAARRATLTEVRTGTEHDVTGKSVCEVLGIENEKFWQRMFQTEENNFSKNNKFQAVLQDVMVEDEAGEASLSTAFAYLEKQRKEWKKKRQDEQLILLDRQLEKEWQLQEQLRVCIEQKEACVRQKEHYEEMIQRCEEEKEHAEQLGQRYEQAKRGGIMAGSLLLAGILLALFTFGLTGGLAAGAAKDSFGYTVGLVTAGLAVLAAIIIGMRTKPISFFQLYGSFAKEWPDMFDEALAEQEQLEREQEQCMMQLAQMCAEETLLEQQLGEYANKKQERERYMKKQQEVLCELRAIEAATESLRLAGIQVQEEKRVQFNRYFSSYLHTFTNGSYTQAHINEQAQWKIFAGEQYRDGKVLSSGTAEQLALSFKLAAEELFAEGKELPLLLDDAFVYYDDERCLTALKELYEKQRQVFIFTCHRREEQLLEEESMEFSWICL